MNLPDALVQDLLLHLDKWGTETIYREAPKGQPIPTFPQVAANHRIMATRLRFAVEQEK